MGPVERELRSVCDRIGKGMFKGKRSLFSVQFCLVFARISQEASDLVGENYCSPDAWSEAIEAAEALGL